MQLLTFVLNHVKFGVPIEVVESIEPKTRVVEVPASPACVRGIMNLHGAIIPVYSLAERFGYRVDPIQNIVVVNMSGMKIGLEVVRVQEMLEVEKTSVAPMPVIMNASQNCFQDVVAHKDELIVMLNVAELIPPEERRKIQKMIEDQKTKKNS